MSITRSVLMALVAVSALTVMAPGHAEAPTQEGQQYASYNFADDARDRMQSMVTTMVTPIVNTKELVCLAKNIFFEAGNQPEEGKVAVGLVTINRVQDGRFANSICGVINQRLAVEVPHQVTAVKEVKTGWLGHTEKHVEHQTVWSKIVVCQFSWSCMRVGKPKTDDERWTESQRVAQRLLEDENNYSDWRSKYSDALYFHATSIRPSWAHQKKRVNTIGGHIFYKE